MGTYAITLNDYSTRFGELFNRSFAVTNTYSTGNKYRHQELVTYGESNTVFIGYGQVWWDEKKQAYQMIVGQGGGAHDLLNINDSNQWVFVKDVMNNNKVTGPGQYWLYAEKFDKYYNIGAGIGEYDNTFTPTNRGYSIAGASSSFAYDSKRGYIVCYGGNWSNPTANMWLTQIDPSKPDSDVGHPLGNQMFHNYLYEGSANNARFITYSTRDDMYYYVDENKIIKVNPDTGVGSVILTKGTDILGLIIEEGSGWGHYGYVDGDDVKLARFNLETPANLYYEINLGNILYFEILYVGKTVVVLCRVDAVSTTPWYTVCFNTVLNLNLTYEKFLYHNHVINNTYRDYYLGTYVNSPISGKSYVPVTNPQKFKPLSNDEVDIHIPVWLGGGGKSRTSTKVLNVNPVTAYPVVTDPTVTDCCLDELKCEINTKLAKKSCEATNRAIVGRHYGCMSDDAELLEALLWITTFDCLTCDEIENLRCITSKI
jgi:hypothetical protein